jgi:hypothetical protein
MGFLTDLVGKFIGGEVPKSDFDELRKILQMEIDANRTNRQGIYGGWEWGESEDGTPTQTQTLAPGMQAGADRLLERYSTNDAPQYESPEQFSQMLDAMMANQMGRMNIGQGQPTPQEMGFGPPSGQQQQPQFQQQQALQQMQQQQMPQNPQMMNQMMGGQSQQGYEVPRPKPHWFA